MNTIRTSKILNENYYDITDDITKVIHLLEDHFKFNDSSSLSLSTNSFWEKHINYALQFICQNYGNLTVFSSMDRNNVVSLLLHYTQLLSPLVNELTGVCYTIFCTTSNTIFSKAKTCLKYSALLTLLKQHINLYSI